MQRINVTASIPVKSESGRARPLCELSSVYRAAVDSEWETQDLLTGFERFEKELHTYLAFWDVARDYRKVGN